MLARMQEKQDELSPVIIIGGDWDGCFDILFDPLLHERFERRYEHQFLAMRHKLNKFLDQITHRSVSVSVTGYDDIFTNIKLGYPVEFYSTSYRQSHPMDKLAHYGEPGYEMDAAKIKPNKNGLSLPNYKVLCMQREWTHRTLLFADVANGKVPGTAYEDELLDYDADPEDKFPIIKPQLDEVKHHHPRRPAHYFIFDDNEKDILLSLVQRFTNGENLPDNIHIHLVKFCWFDEIFKKQKGLYEVAHIHQGKILSGTAMPVPQEISYPVRVIDPGVSLEPEVKMIPVLTEKSPSLNQISQPESSCCASFKNACKSFAEYSCCFWKRCKKTPPVSETPRAEARYSLSNR
ncbi:MAG TPA: hypothetical protein VLI69_05890 [Gammaproteobacteria bacterium]|nr:hypothetical protein [Gammaproteobacteria bacterium]